MIKIELYSGEVILTQRAIDEGGKGLYVPRRHRFLHWHRICRISGDYRIAVNDRGENVYVGLPVPV